MSATQTSQFIDFLLGENVLRFGEFTLNSGRVSPYFFNLGEVNSGPGFATLGEAYAAAIVEQGVECDVLFGPAYKGIPIAVATATALARRGVEVGVAYNRKEAKDHGEGGRLVGAAVEGKVLLIDDVLTSGKAIRDAVGLINDTDAQIVGAVIAMDRQEVMDLEKVPKVTAVGQLSEEIAAPVISIANMSDLIRYLDEGDAQVLAQAGLSDALARMRRYQEEYCAA